MFYENIQQDSHLISLLFKVKLSLLWDFSLIKLFLEDYRS